ncbi:type II toxin-antitoxin system RelE/ParE family toxin [Trinickia sp.]|uniref:type II toxin-antitoxin system RelE/ParE family toxin n=1 Tax=Trinickia sp. TaxID=2571163 RepID=UPI003F81CB6B
MNLKNWTVVFHEAFEPEFRKLDPTVRRELLSTALAVQQMGPDAGRPYVGTLSNAKHPNMKALRFTANGGAEVWRVAFAFDPERKAIVLVAGDKQGMNDQLFYKRLLQVANARFDRHLARLTHVAKPAKGTVKRPA